MSASFDAMIYDCDRLGAKPFLLSLLAGVWFVVLNVLNACTQPPAEVVLKHSAVATRSSKPQAIIPVVKNSPVQTVVQSELPPLVPAQPMPENTHTSARSAAGAADPSIAELIETGERLTLGNGVINATAPVPTQNPKQQSSNVMFIWPVQGRIISAFGEKPGGLRNDGINIAAQEGEPIRAIADGEVLYTSNAVKGYGNLLLIRHSKGWISTYAHNKTTAVTQGESVKQGDVIAYVGKTGNVVSPQLHFSLRKDKKPVNPSRYLATNLAQKK